MEVISENQNGIIVVRAQGTLNVAYTPQFQEKMQPLVETTPKNLVLDCTKIDYISSIGLRAILEIGKTLKSKQSQLLLVAPKGLTSQIFENAGFGLLFSIHSSAEEAVASIK
jgi:anti-anti-sigma factor